MRVLLLDQFSDPGGAQQVLLELLPALQGRGWPVLAGLPGKGELFRHMAALGIEAAEIACGPFASGAKSLADARRLMAQTPRLARQIRKLEKRHGADLIYVNGPRLLPAAALARWRAPVLFHSHSYLAPGMIRRLAGGSLRWMEARVIASCRFVAEAWLDFVPAERVSVVYNGVAGCEGTDASRGERRAIGCVGRIAPEKGQREFVKAAAAIHRQLPDCRFLVYGAALFGDVEAQRYEAGVRAAAEGLPIEFKGWEHDICRALAGLDLLLVPSARHEATTRVILEAFAAGVPVIAFPSGGIPEVVEDGSTGFLAASPEAMAETAIRLLESDREELVTIAGQARAGWQAKFTLEHFQKQVMEAMERACRGAS